ncbi:MAG: 50S ribosomal protein L23 [Patescibacteria group bacterium]
MSSAAGQSGSVQVLLKPVITEKATNLTAENKYVFAVSPEANKISVAKAVKAIYGVTPIKVNLINISGKKVARGRVRGVRSDRRKAIVTLKAGEAIKIYEGV